MSDDDVKPCPPLVTGEVAWVCGFVMFGDSGHVEDYAQVTPELREALATHAARLYLELADRDVYSVWLIHRAGWPFDLKLRKSGEDVIGWPVANLRPTGAGDEVMRDLIDSFEYDFPGSSLDLTSEQRG